jgi:hypothetical protein
MRNNFIIGAITFAGCSTVATIGDFTYTALVFELLWLGCILKVARYG